MVHASTTPRSVCVGFSTAWSIIAASAGTVGSTLVVVMPGSILVARLLGIDIRIHLSWFLVFAIVLLSLADQRGILAQLGPGWTQRELVVAAAVASLLFFASVVVHELAHATVARAFRMPVSSITLFLLGGVANLAKEPPRAAAEFLMAIAGPLTSLAIGAAGLGICQIVFAPEGGCGGLLDGRVSATFAAADAVAVVAAYLGVVNVLLAVFNMIPGFPLDGGRVLRSVVWGWLRDRSRATHIAARGGQLVAGLLLLLAAWRAIGRDDTFGALWMGFIAYFLYTAASQAIDQERVAAAVAGVRVASLMSTQLTAVAPTATIAQVVDEHILARNARAVAVIDGGRFAGLVTVAGLRKVAQREWRDTPVERAMTPARELEALTPGSRLITAIERLGASDIPALPVVEDGVLVGLLERDAVASYVRMREMLGLR
ncbi:MAG: CBS domain-containing protein [Chloroflexi bacterium]|nr:CBS domain-containing protein [Chloroflexota bacterium]